MELSSHTGQTRWGAITRAVRLVACPPGNPQHAPHKPPSTAEQQRGAARTPPQLTKQHSPSWTPGGARGEGATNVPVLFLASSSTPKFSQHHDSSSFYTSFGQYKYPTIPLVLKFTFLLPMLCQNCLPFRLWHAKPVFHSFYSYSAFKDYVFLLRVSNLLKMNFWENLTVGMNSNPL